MHIGCCTAIRGISSTLCSADVTHKCTCLVNKANLLHNFLSKFISFLYMFWVTMCPSSGEITVSIQHLVFVTLCGWLFGMQGAPRIPDSHPHRVTNTKCHIGTVISPDDGHIVAWNM